MGIMVVGLTVGEISEELDGFEKYIYDEHEDCFGEYFDQFGLRVFYPDREGYIVGICVNEYHDFNDGFYKGGESFEKNVNEAFEKILKVTKLTPRLFTCCDVS